MLPVVVDLKAQIGEWLRALITCEVEFLDRLRGCLATLAAVEILQEVRRGDEDERLDMADLPQIRPAQKPQEHFVRQLLGILPAPHSPLKVGRAAAETAGRRVEIYSRWTKCSRSTHWRKH